MTQSDVAARDNIIRRQKEEIANQARYIRGRLSEIQSDSSLTGGHGYDTNVDEAARLINELKSLDELYKQGEVAHVRNMMGVTSQEQGSPEDIQEGLRRAVQARLRRRLP